MYMEQSNFSDLKKPSTRIFYKKPGSRPSSKCFLSFGDILVLKVLKSMKKISVITKAIWKTFSCSTHKAWYIKHTVEETVKPVEEKGVSKTVKDGAKVSQLFPFRSKSFLDFRVSSARFLINLSLFKKACIELS